MQSPEGHEAGPLAVRAATRLLRELIDVTDDFEASLRAELTVNSTDLEAIEHLLMSGPLNATELSRRLGISTAAMTTSIDRLVALGHAHREPNPSDRRGVIVVPSAESRVRAMARLMPMIMEVDAALDDFGADDQLTITRYLESVVGVYRRHAAGPASPLPSGPSAPSTRIAE